MNAVGGRGPCERENIVPVAGGGAALGGDLHGMGRVENNGESLFGHDANAAKVNDEVVVTIGGAAFGEPDGGVAAVDDFVRDIAHVFRSHELGFFDVDDFSGFCGGDEQVRLSTEECGDLNDVEHFGGGLDLRDVVDIAEDLQSGGFLDRTQHVESRFESRASKGGKGRAIGLVEAGFENEVYTGMVSRDGFEFVRDVECD